MGYTHLTMDEREHIAQMKAAGDSVTTIARALGRAPATIYRELSRNADPGRRYSPWRADAAYRRRRRHSRRPYRIEGHLILNSRILENLRATWSPEQIAGRLPLDFPLDAAMRVGRSTIYRFIARDRAAGGRLHEHLRRRGRRRKRYGSGPQRRGRIPGCRPLAQRPAIAARRGRLGDFEGDTVCAGRAAAIATHVDRRSRFLVAAVLADGRASTFNRATARAMARLPPRLRCLTLTVDNGKEFAEHRALEETLGAKVYFAPPYQSWQRGTNENTNGLLREFFPKKACRRPTAKALARAVHLINNRPRKCLHWRTPTELVSDKGNFH